MSQTLLQTSNTTGSWLDFLPCGFMMMIPLGIVGTVALIAYLVWQEEEKRRQSIAQSFVSMGFRATAHPDNESRERAFRALYELPQVWPAGVWLAFMDPFTQPNLSGITAIAKGQIGCQYVMYLEHVRIRRHHKHRHRLYDVCVVACRHIDDALTSEPQSPLIELKLENFPSLLNWCRETSIPILIHAQSRTFFVTALKRLSPPQALSLTRVTAEMRNRTAMAT